MRKSISLVLISFLALMIVFQPLVLAVEVNDISVGAKIFNVHCAGCHPHGNNIIRRGKNLKQKALKRNGLDSLEAIAYLVRNGKNNMSAFQERLSEKQIKEVAAYVLTKAENNWR
jgi:cytochrome c6